MPEIKEYFPELDDMDRETLLRERETILSSVQNGDYNALPDDDLSKLIAVNRCLRQKNAGPPKKSLAKTEVSSDDLA